MTPQLWEIAPDDVQAQYRGTNIEGMVRGVADIRKKYLGNAIRSLFEHNINITTAKEDGLDLWGYLLHFSRCIPQDTDPIADVNYFNFNEKNFRRMQFYNPLAPNYGRLTDDVFRRFLILLYQGMFVVNTIPNINKFINEALGNVGADKIEVRDTFDMSYQTYVFYNNGTLPAWLKWILNNYDVLPRPAGVGATYIDRQPVRRFGFAPDGTTDQWYYDNIGAFGNTNFSEIEE